MNEAQVGDQIFDLAALVKACGSDDDIRKSGLDQRFFERSRLCIRAIKNRRVAALGAEGDKAIDDITGFVTFVLRRI